MCSIIYNDMGTFTIVITYTDGRVETPKMDSAALQKLIDEKKSGLHREIKIITINYESAPQGI